MQIITETQRITAGNNFTGAVPLAAVPKSYRAGNLIYAPADAGGLFTFPIDEAIGGALLLPSASMHAMRVLSILIEFGAQASWTLDILDAQDTVFPYALGTNELSHVTLPPNRLVLPPGSRFRLITVAAANAMSCAITYEVYRKID